MTRVQQTTEDTGHGLISVVEAQRRTKVDGPELMRAVVYGEVPSVRGPHGLDLVRLDDVRAWATSR